VPGFPSAIETRSLPTLTRSYPRRFAFYVACPAAPFAALTHSRRNVVQRYPWLISFSLDAVSTRWSEIAANPLQAAIWAYVMIGLIVSVTLRFWIRPRLRQGLGNSLQWETKGDARDGLYWVLTLLTVHPITYLLGVLLWPLSLTIVLIVRFMR
jgi:hypothetical protein